MSADVQNGLIAISGDLKLSFRDRHATLCFSSASCTRLRSAMKRFVSLVPGLVHLFINLASGPPSGSLRYTASIEPAPYRACASRLSYCRPVPPRRVDIRTLVRYNEMDLGVVDAIGNPCSLRARPIRICTR